MGSRVLRCTCGSSLTYKDSAMSSIYGIRSAGYVIVALSSERPSVLRDTLFAMNPDGIYLSQQ